jgi:quercetin dioxygenase-like cupin family protein
MTTTTATTTPTAAHAYPHTIDNGGGEQLTFLARRTDERGEYLEVTNTVRPGSGPPMHVHHLQEESLTVVSGTMAWQRPGGPEHTAGPGETVTFPAGDPHRFWNPGTDDLVCTGTVRPPDNIEYFLGAIYESTKRNGGERPNALDAAYLTRRYRTEFEILEVPAPVRRFVLPVIAVVAGVLGRKKRYADAPEPIER